jgi:hypothetical protein
MFLSHIYSAVCPVKSRPTSFKYNFICDHTLLYATLLYATLRYSTILDATRRYATLLYSTLLYATLRYSTLLYATLLYSSLRYSFKFTFQYHQKLCGLPKINTKY